MADALSCPNTEPHEFHGWGAGPPWHVCPGIPEPAVVEATRLRDEVERTERAVAEARSALSAAINANAAARNALSAARADHRS